MKTIMRRQSNTVMVNRPNVIDGKETSLIGRIAVENVIAMNIGYRYQRSSGNWKQSAADTKR